MAGRPATTALRETWRANVDLPRPWGPAMQAQRACAEAAADGVVQDTEAGGPEGGVGLVGSKAEVGAFEDLHEGGELRVHDGIETWTQGRLMTRMVGNDPKGWGRDLTDRSGRTFDLVLPAASPYSGRLYQRPPVVDAPARGDGDRRRRREADDPRR